MPETIKKLLEKTLELLAFAASMTSTKIDDTAVGILRTVLASDLLMDWLNNELVTSAPAYGSADCPNVVLEELAAAGYDEDAVDAFCATALPAVRGLTQSVV